MNKIEKFCKNYNDEIIAVGAGVALGLAVIVALQAREIRTIRGIWAKNDKIYYKLLGENELLIKVIKKVL